MVVVLGVYEIPQGNSHYILYVGSLIVLSSTLNKASVLLPAKLAPAALYSDIFALASPKIPPTIVAHFQQKKVKKRDQQINFLNCRRGQAGFGFKDAHSTLHVSVSQGSQCWFLFF